MTRADALKVAKTLQDIEILEMFMDDVEKLFDDYPELKDIHGLVMIPLKCELKNREAVLADMQEGKNE